MAGAPLKGFWRFAQRIGWGRLIGAALLAGFVALRAWDPVPVELLRLRAFDTYQIIQPREVTAKPVVIVDIDDASLAEYGQFPWPRNLIASLIQQISARGAAAIGFDIVFPEPDRTSPRSVADTLQGLSEEQRAALRGLRDHDEILAGVLQRSRVVLGQSAYNPKKGSTRKNIAPKASFATLGEDPKPFLIEYPDLLANIELLEKAAAGRGMFTVLPDPDGVIRRVPVVLVANGNLVPSLSMDMLRVATGQTTYLIKTQPTGIQSMVVARVEMPADENGQLWIHFSPHRPDRYVSAKDVLAGKVPVERLQGKLVLIGTSASGLLDLRATPVDPAMPGVEIHAQLLESALTNTLLKRPDYMSGAEILLALAVGLAILVLAPIFGAMTILLSGAVVAAGLVGLSWYFFTTSGMLLDVSYPLGSSFAVFITMMSVNYMREEAERRQVRSAFGQYLSPDLVEQLAEDPDRLVLGGETREMTILFSDVRDFTTISETFKEDPQGLTVLINRLLTPLSHAIMEQSGTIDKYMGDNVMAFWNAPLDDPDHARHACLASFDMLTRLNAVNEERRAEAEAAGTPVQTLDIGIGINTGEVVVGNMGSDVRFDYSVLGDAVNLAARLEGQSKSYGVKTIIGERTAQLVGDQFVAIELDSIRVKGKTEPEIIYTIFSPDQAANGTGLLEAKEAVSKMLAAYRDQNWTAAQRAIRECRKIDTGPDLSILCDMYAERVAGFKKSPPPKDWDGVFTATSK